MRLALAQLDAVVGDLAGNRALIVDAIREARAAGADLVVFPELAVTGLPARGSAPAARASSRPPGPRSTRSRAATEGITALVGVPALRSRPRQRVRRALRRRAARASIASTSCPTTASSTSTATSRAGRELLLLRCGDVLVGPTICEDIWQPGPPATDLALAGAQLLVNLSASPFHVGKAEDREEMLVTRARDNASYLAFCNLVGGQDELVFDGHSVVLDDEGEVDRAGARVRGGAARRRPRPDRGDRAPPARRAPPELERTPRRRARGDRDRSSAAAGTPATPVAPTVVPFEPELEQMRLALGLGLRDYVEKSGFREVVLGISGGIDSALTAAICADALGADRVHTVSMPSRYSSEGTRDDAREVSANLGATSARSRSRRRRLVRGGTRRLVRGREPDLTEENLQARVRGTLLMALSNKFGWLVVSTGNKSELAVGYATLYGDMVGGLRAAEGRVQDRRLSALRGTSTSGRARADPRHDDRAPAERRAARRRSATTSRCPRTTFSTRCSRPTWSSTARARSCSRSSMRRRSRRCSAWSTGPSTSAARRLPA